MFIEFTAYVKYGPGKHQFLSVRGSIVSNSCCKQSDMFYLREEVSLKRILVLDRFLDQMHFLSYYFCTIFYRLNVNLSSSTAFTIC